MSKLNPIMKHLPLKCAAGKPTVSVEEFMDSIPASMEEIDGVIVDNSVPAWINTQETQLDAIDDAEATADELDSLAADVDTVTTAVGMESYRRIFAHLTRATGLPIHESVGLEGFTQTRGGKRKLAKAIREHAELVRQGATIALEDFVDNSGDTLSKAMADFKQTLGELDKVDRNLDAPNKGIKMNNQRLYEMFYRNGQVTGPDVIHFELEALKRLAGLLGKGVDEVVKEMDRSEGDKGRELAGSVLQSLFGGAGAVKGKTRSGQFGLMFNTQVVVQGNRAKLIKNEVPPPEKSFSAGDWAWLAGWGVLGLVAAVTTPLGILAPAVAMLFGGLHRTAAGTNGERDISTHSSEKEMHDFVASVKKFGPIAAEVQRDVEDLIKAVKAAPEGRQAQYKRAATPVIELGINLINHMTEVAHGASILFEKITAA